MKIRCILVDDEPLARKVLMKYISDVDTLELVKACRNASEAIAVLHQQRIDLMFLDMKMPDMAGLDLLNTIPSPPKVIITTAFSEYSLDGYEYSVVDFLLKPFPFERFIKAVNKAIQLIVAAKPANSIMQKEVAKDFIFLKVDRALHKVSLADILYLEGYGNYLKVFTNQRMLLIQDTMTNMENLLPNDQFVRVHKSYIVAIQRIEQIEDGWINIKDKEIPIGNTYKHEFYNRLNKDK